MRHYNYYNWNSHKLLSQYYFFNNSYKQKTYKKCPLLVQRHRHQRLINRPRMSLKRFVYGTVRPRRDVRRL